MSFEAFRAVEFYGCKSILGTPLCFKVLKSMEEGE
jgi:hypothetical protein